METKTTQATSRWIATPYGRGFVLVHATFDFQGKPFVAIETKIRQIEIYSVDPTGLEMFTGYVGNQAIPATLAMAAVEALCSRPTDNISPRRTP